MTASPRLREVLRTDLSICPIFVSSLHRMVRIMRTIVVRAMSTVHLGTTMKFRWFHCTQTHRLSDRPEQLKFLTFGLEMFRIIIEIEDNCSIDRVESTQASYQWILGMWGGKKSNKITIVYSSTLKSRTLAKDLSKNFASALMAAWFAHLMVMACDCCRSRRSVMKFHIHCRQTTSRGSYMRSASQ